MRDPDLSCLGNGNLWKKSMGTIKIERFFPSKAQFDLVVQYFRSSFTQNSQPVDLEIVVYG
jgi:hypothetical protein